jgi:hypothetical protein
VEDSGQSQPSGPGVCPFVALVGDRNRRADGPDPNNRCYAEPAPRQRDDAYQAEYCYSPQFAGCSVFLGWAARNAAEPAHISDAAKQASAGASILASGERSAADSDETGEGDFVGDSIAAVPGTPEGGLFGAAGEAEKDTSLGSSDDFDWVPAAAWSGVPYDERAEAEADELAAIKAAEPEDAGWLELDDDDDEPEAEALIGPKVPAALPLRKRKPPLQPIRTRGSGEWFYADAPDREPLVKRRYGVAPPALLVVLGLLVVALIVFMIPTLFSGGDGGQTAAASPSPNASQRPAATRAPTVVATPSPVPSPTTPPKIRTYTVKSGDSLSGIAEKRGVDLEHLQCMNNIKRKNIVVLGARLQIPPAGYVCPAGWRNAE